ncbi:hypothetical protein BC941DRAFT_249559 [Chlamydoabsidia padenii]|nr:hypothetical protein BC941DRAFT_249559 [Chlamydoabsidia padenii]
MIGFHDVLKTQRWELRCLAFFLGIVEANAFSAFKHFRDEGEDVLHTTFRWRLVEGLKVHINGIKGGNTGNTMGTRGQVHRADYHKLVPLGKHSLSGDYIRRVCIKCKVRTQHKCICAGDALCQKCHPKHVLDVERSANRLNNF